MHWEVSWFMAALLAMGVCVCELVWIVLLHQRVQELEQERDARWSRQSWDVGPVGDQDDRGWW
jgi:hypothetical protein